MLLFLTALLTQCDNVIDNNNDTGDNPSAEEPVLISPVDRATNQALSVEFNWQKYNGVESFRFQLSENAVFSSTVKDTVTGDRTILVNSLHPNKRYYWKIFPLNPSATSKWSEARTFQTGSDDIQPAITDLKAPEKGSIITPDELLFTWESISEADRYYLQIAEDHNFNESLIDSLLSTEQFATQNLELDNAYQWRVTPVSETITGHWSEISEFKLVSEEDLEANIVTLLQPENESTQLETEITLEWEKVDDYETYLLQLTATDNFNDPLIDKFIDASTYTATDLENGTEYRWRVKPHSDNLVYPWSNVWSFSTKDELQIPKLTLKSPENQTEDVPVSVTFSWNAEDGFTEYQFQLADNNSFSNPISDESMSNSSLKVDDLDEETTYYWRARIIHDDKKGAWSEIWSFTTEAGEIEIPRVSLVSPDNGAEDLPTEVEFSWEKADGFDNYRFQLADNSNFSDRIENSVVEGESISVKDLRNDQTFYWRVRIVHDGNNGPWSEVRSFRTVEEEIIIPRVTLVSPSNNASDLDTEITFEWNEEAGFSDYRFQLSQNSNFSSPIENKTVQGSSVVVSGLENGRTHYWRVRIVYQGENGEWSQSRSFTTKEQTVTPPPPSNAFVTARNGNFEINGNVFRFSGTNAYYLPNYQKINSLVVDNAFDIFEETGINVVRMWAFYDGYDCGYSQYDSSENVIQTAPGEYSESALRDLDRVIAKGKERGIRFILPFVNYWDELGGICQYNTWAGASNPGRNMEFFLSNSDTQKWYRDYIKMLLNRVNTVTGVAYKDEPAIFAWQIMNEGRNSGADPRILRDWYREIAQLIKSIAPNHMVSTGEEGFDEGTPSEYSVSQYSNTYVLRANEGTSYIMNTSIPEIDFGSAHWYPQDFGFGNNADSNVLNAQRAWLSDHQRIAADLGKPFILGEWGYAGWGNSTQRTIYDELYEHAESINLDGNLIWQLTADGEKCWEFGGNICYPGGRADTELYNRFRQHVQNIKP